MDKVNRLNKRKHNLREVWDEINYLVKTVCQWRLLPNNFPKWQLVKKVYGYLIKVVMRRYNETDEFKPINKRWVIERTFAWFDNNRDYEEIMNF